MSSIGHNTQIGIQLAQQGRNLEALAYLRHAAKTEPLNAEVWLWLAHVTPDLAEYRHCVHQALVFDPFHPTALRMQQDLDFQGRGASPPSFAPPISMAMDKVPSGQRRLRRILLLLCAIVMVSACGVLADRISQNIDTSNLSGVVPFLPQTKTIEFGIGSEPNTNSFTVDIPTTWYLTDTGSPSWREQRERLQEEFPEATPWRALESDFGTAEPNPITGKLSAPVAIVETLSARIQPYLPSLTLAQLLAIQTLPERYGDNGCQNLRRLAGDVEIEQREQAGYISTQVKQQDSETCVYLTEFNQTDSNGTIIRRLNVFIPVEDNQLAEWEIRIPENEYADIYQQAVETFISSLRWIEAKPALAPTP